MLVDYGRRLDQFGIKLVRTIKFILLFVNRSIHCICSIFLINNHDLCKLFVFYGTIKLKMLLLR